MTQQTAMTAAQRAQAEKLAQFKSVAELLQSENVMNAIARALPRHMTPERMIRVALTAIQKTPKLAECEQRSLIGALVQAAELGLEPNTPLGHCYLIPYWNGKTQRNEAQLMIGYRGFIALARRSGQVNGIYAEIVYEKDYFEISYGLNKDLIHRPALNEEDRGQMIGVYAVAKFKDGYTDFEYMDAVTVGKHRARSQSPDKGPWQTDTGEMWRKTPIRRIAKRLPLSIEDETLKKAIDADARFEANFENLAPLELGTGEPVAVITEEQRIALVEAAKASGAPLTDAVQDAGFEMLAEITVDRYDAILAAVSEVPEKPAPVVGGESAQEPETAKAAKPKAEKTKPEPTPEDPAEPKAESFTTPEEALAESCIELAQIKSGGREMDARELLGGRNAAAVRKMKLEDLQELHANLMQK